MPVLLLLTGPPPGAGSLHFNPKPVEALPSRIQCDVGDPGPDPFGLEFDRFADMAKPPVGDGIEPLKFGDTRLMEADPVEQRRLFDVFRLVPSLPVASLTPATLAQCWSLGLNRAVARRNGAWGSSQRPVEPAAKIPWATASRSISI